MQIGNPLAHDSLVLKVMACLENESVSQVEKFNAIIRAGRIVSAYINPHCSPIAERAIRAAYGPESESAYESTQSQILADTLGVISGQEPLNTCRNRRSRASQRSS